MTDALLVAAILLNLLALGLIIALWLRRPTLDSSVLQGPLDDQFTRSRQESAQGARQLREEVAAASRTGQESLLNTLTRLATAQQNQLDIFAGQLQRFTRDQAQAGQELRQELANRTQALSESLDKRIEALRGIVDAQLLALRQENSAKLEQMRHTVDEKLQGTLEKRLGESFKLVSERLEQVHKGLGEMQALATGVGDLKKVLTNVKTRGTWGEVQLGALLEQMLAPEQYEANVATRPGSNERVEFAIRLPGAGPDADSGRPLYLPIDAKFPTEDYQRLLEASEAADAPGVEAALRALENRIRGFAREVHDKYIDPPHTTDLALLFLPTEGLYAEVIRRVALIETLRRDYHVEIVGPTTLCATLNALRMGFRTLAIEKRSAEVWQILGAVKTEFGKFSEVLAKVQSKLQEAGRVIDSAGVRTRAIERKLRQVQELPADQAQTLLQAPDPQPLSADP